jgi:hypothetical protein
MLWWSVGGGGGSVASNPTTWSSPANTALHMQKVSVPASASAYDKRLKLMASPSSRLR